MCETKIPELDANNSIYSLLRSNHPPSAVQAQALKVLLEKQTAEVRHAELGWARLLLKMNCLLQKMKALNNRWKENEELALAYQYIMSPIHRLPSEILVQIFDFAVEEDVETLSPHRCGSSPLGLSQVCSAWRHAALSHSRLWNQLSVDVSAHINRQLSKASSGDLITTWFGRTGNQTLLQLSLHNSLARSSRLEEMVKRVTPFARRISLRTLSPKALIPLLTLPGGTMPVLENLVLVVESSVYNICLRLPPVTVFDGSPQLKNATLGINSPILHVPERFVLPWCQLTCLKFELPIRLHTFSQIIRHCGQLEVAAFHISTNTIAYEDDWGDMDESDDSDQPSEGEDEVDNIPKYPIPENNHMLPLIPHRLEFPRLTSLKLGIACHMFIAQELCNLFRRLRFPALKSLELEGDPDYKTLNEIMPSIVDSLDLMEHLSLSYTHSLMIEPEDHFIFICACPLLESLAMRTSQSSLALMSLEMLCRDSLPVPLAYLKAFILGVEAMAVDMVSSYAQRFCACVERWRCERPGSKQTLKAASMHICNRSQDNWYDMRFISEKQALNVLDEVEDRLRGDELVQEDLEFETSWLESYDDLHEDDPYKLV
ncbi:hypothetical protein H0H81_010854 [Sphagnurus paluster]|uniref:F-box domain-containing protein n=1 Tax=Sphagnurus paluster TaxID=117069 RepID=A0A9P7GIV5_9AGAR|nr:hypothetical protein H0H81_010854 [Sphagnurus paluster]